MGDHPGRVLLVAMLVLLVCDVVGGAIGVATGAETWGTAWGFDTRSFDGDLIGNIESDGLLSWGVAWAFVLLALTAVVGLLALTRARQLRRRP